MEKQESRIDLSVIMPALNEEANIGAALDETLSAFKDVGLRGEIIVVNDGSTDGTRAVVTGKSQIGDTIVCIDHPRPLGLGASFRDGVLRARGEAVVFIPGDNENEPAEIMRYFHLLQEVDMVVPFVFNKEVRPKFRNLISTVFRMIVNITFAVNFNYTNGTVIYRRRLLQEDINRSDGFFFQTENVVKAVWNGYLFAEVPYRLEMRNAGESKAISLRSLKAVVSDYLRLVKDIYFTKTGREKRPNRETISGKRREAAARELGVEPKKYSRE